MRRNSTGAACLAPRYGEILHPVGQGGGRVVDGERLASDGELEHPLGVDARALQSVEVLRQLTGLQASEALALSYEDRCDP